MSVPNTFVAGTRARSAEVNANFNSITNGSALDNITNGIKLNVSNEENPLFINSTGVIAKSTFIYNNSAYTGIGRGSGAGLLSVEMENALAIGDAVSIANDGGGIGCRISNNGDGDALFIDKNNSGNCINIDLNITDSTNCYGMRMDIDNGGAGVEYAFRFDGNEQQNSSPGTLTESGYVRIVQGGVTKWLKAYTPS